MQEYAQNLFFRALASVSVEARISEAVRVDSNTLEIATSVFDIRRLNRIAIVAVGKAAVPMAHSVLAALQSLGNRVHVEGVVVSGWPPELRDSRFCYITGAHPFPDDTSRKAALAVLRFLQAIVPHTLVLYLISGGASAMLELPVDASISVEDMYGFYQSLVHSGLPISKMNTLRKHFSAVKGGRLAELAGNVSQVTLLVSDVPGDNISTIGSGPSVPDPSTVQDCRDILRESGLTPQLPRSVQAYFAAPDLPETLKLDAPCFAQASFHVLVPSGALVDKAAEIASADGFHTEIDLSCDDWEYDKAAAHLLARFDQLQREHAKVCLISGGELSVPLPAAHGIGGRNQHFALECALRLHRNPQDVTVLSAGSDGLDGNSPAAGAIVNQNTCAAAVARGLNPLTASSQFDSYPFFRDLGLAIVTGPTGNNLRDLRLLL